MFLTVQSTPPLEEVLVPSYLPATSDFFPVFVSAVDKEGSVWVQRVEGTDPASLDSLVETMTSDYSQLSAQVTPPDLVCINFGLLVLFPGSGSK